MTAESLLITYVQVGVAISGFSGIVVSLGKRGRGEWSYHERQLLYTLLGTSGGCTLLSALPLVLASTGIARADRVVRQQRLLGGPATRAHGGPGAAGRPRRGHARPRAVDGRRGIRRRGGVRGVAARELRLAGCRLAAPGHDHVAPRPLLHRLRAARPT